MCGIVSPVHHVSGQFLYGMGACAIVFAFFLVLKRRPLGAVMTIGALVVDHRRIAAGVVLTVGIAATLHLATATYYDENCDVVSSGWDGVSAGTCIRDDPDRSDGEVRRTGCSHGHWGEAYAVPNIAELVGVTYPGDAEVSQVARQACESIGQRGAQLPRSGYVVNVIRPTVRNWAVNDRTAVCVLRRLDSAPWTGK